MSAVADFPIKPEVRPYLDAFVDNPQEPQWLREARRRALNSFAELGFPSRKSESWRYLDPQSIGRNPRLPVVTGALAMVPAELGANTAWPRVVLANGSIVHRPSAYDMPVGVDLKSIRRLVQRDWPQLNRAAMTSGDSALSALNTAFFSDGVLLDIASGVVIEKPIEVVHFSSTGAAHTRSVIRLGDGSRAVLVETYTGEGDYSRNDVRVVQLGDSAELTRIVLVEETAEAVHLGSVDATLGAGARLNEFVLLLGGGTVRHEVNVTIAGDKAECRIDGAYLLSGREEANIVTTIDHQAVGGTTNELIKGVAAGRSHGAFQGKIIVREGAQQTDARQTSRNLILGRRAVIDTKPELEILADDVKCAHGASVGELDETALFYLRSRGIPAEEARRLLVEGFLAEAFDSVADPAIREHLLRRLSMRLGRLEEWS